MYPLSMALSYVVRTEGVTEDPSKELFAAGKYARKIAFLREKADQRKQSPGKVCATSNPTSFPLSRK
jgi:hypothetical protein